MKSNFTLLFVVFFSFSALSQIPVFEDNFDSYTVNQGVAYQSAVWETWTGGAGGGTNDARVSDEHAQSVLNSMKMIDGRDMVYKFGNISTGHYSIEFNAYFHEQGYFNLQHTMGSNWAVDIYLTAANEIKYLEEDGIANSIVVGSYVNDQWTNFKFEIDFELDTILFFVDDVLLHSSNFSNSLDFTPSSNLDIMNFYGLSGFNGVTNTYYYVDDFKVIDLAHTAGISALPVKELTVFPNPAKDVVTINAKDNLKNIVIYDMAGQIVHQEILSGTNYQFSLAAFPSGIYSVKIITETSTAIEKLVVN